VHLYIIVHIYMFFLIYRKPIVCVMKFYTVLNNFGEIEYEKRIQRGI